jgi:hypothetical protein
MQRQSMNCLSEKSGGLYRERALGLIYEFCLPKEEDQQNQILYIIEQ